MRLAEHMCRQVANQVFLSLKIEFGPAISTNEVLLCSEVCTDMHSTPFCDLGLQPRAAVHVFSLQYIMR